LLNWRRDNRLPIFYPYRDYVELGGLIAYAPDLGELAQRLADNVHQILNGATAGDIPIYQPTRFQLVVNLKAAKDTRPHRADDTAGPRRRVIE
jgi:putative ABC transport system substrate-binding protein